MLRLLSNILKVLLGFILAILVYTCCGGTTTNTPDNTNDSDNTSDDIIDSIANWFGSHGCNDCKPTENI